MDKKTKRLRDLADKMTAQIEAKRNPAIGEQNYTRRRARIADSMRRDADRLEKVQYVLYGLADAREQNELHPLLEKVMNKKLIENMLYYDEWPRWEEDQIRFTKAGLTPENYSEAKAALVALGDPPDRSEERRRIELENRAKELVKQIPGFFPTPPEVVSKMLDYADKWQHDLRILEPSAGAGHIADVILEEMSYEVLHVIEIAPSLRELLEVKGYDVIASDFLDFEPEIGYDRILMNPPFESDQDMAHVYHAYDCLAPGGRLVSVMSEGTFFRGNASGFREWLDNLGGWDVDLPPNAFNGSGTGVKTRLVVIDKPAKQEIPITLPDNNRNLTQLALFEIA